MSGYKVEEVDGPTTYYDSSGNTIKIEEQGNSLVPSSGQSGQSGQYKPSKLEMAAAAIGAIAALKNPFSSDGSTIGESVVYGAKKAGNYIADKTTEKLKNWWNQPKIENKKTEQRLIEGPKGGGAKKTTKQTKEQAVPKTREIQTKQITEVGTVSTQVKKDQIQQAAQRLIEQEPQEDPLYAYERESIRNIEAAQRKRVPWRLPPIDVGMTRMTGFEPFSSTADQTFNVFYGSGSIDPFIRS